MPVRSSVLTASLAIGLATGGAWLAFAQSPEVLGNNEGIFVDSKSFNVTKGKSKTDASAQIARLNAKEVGPGAIIFRSGDKLYIVDGRPPGAAVQGMKDFQDTFTMMKDFQDTFTMMK